ncbi:MAG: hypothetical protein HOD64_05180 [Candidatus Cloacimonetes bacterium]|jgi:hypothetical protein|nr:hypothetical protein [Candidatus Cloacimonadota bacterium]
MVKKNKQKVEKQIGFLEKIFEGKYRHVIFISLLFIILSVFFFNIAFKNYAPPAGDTIQWRSSAQVLMEYNKEHKDQAMWNPNVFSGMPSYLISFGAKYPFVGQIFKLTNKVMNWRILMLFIMALGVYLFMIHLKFDPIIAFISAIALPLSCHFLGLLEIGHNTKFKAIVYIPWIMFAVHYLKERRSLLALGATAILFIVQLRANHPQISYYTYLMILIYWIVQLIWAIKDKELRSHIIFSVFLLLALLIAFMAIAQPYFSSYEYGHYTIRGGETGLSTSYATSWSFHPMEILTFVNPSFYGGISPFYWGWMPFTQTSMYMGIIIFLFALIALFYNRNRLVKILLSVSIVTLLLSFGRHLPFLSNFLLNYLPGFNKFRVPAMILVILQFATVILAGFGIKTIIEKIKEDDKKFFDLFQKILIAVFVLFVIFLAFSSSLENLSLQHSGDASKYNPGQLKQLKTMRLDKLVEDGIQTGIFLIVSMGLILLAGRKKIGKYPFLILIAILVITDLLLIDSRFLQNVTPQQNIEREYQKTDADKFLLQDTENFRIYPLAREFGQNSWAYYHQTIGGYHGAKLKRYQEIIENCMNAEFLDRIPINWNIVNMLNAKYVVFNQKLPIDNLEYAYYDRKEKQTVYLNNTYLSRAWFVKNTELIADSKSIWKKLNDPEFSPAETAIVEKEVPITYAPTKSSVTPAGFGLHDIKFEVVTDTTSFLTISEIYYPAGWKAFVDGEETEIFATNYILRGIVVPKGEHTIEMKFESSTYSWSLKLSLIGLILAVLIFLIGLYIYIRSNFQGKIVYVLKE